MENKFKKLYFILFTAILMSLPRIASAVDNPGERCFEHWYLAPVAWDFTYEYQKTCHYGAMGQGWIGQYYWEWRGVGEYTTGWESSPQCASSSVITLFWTNITDPFINKEPTAGTGYFEYADTNQKVISKTPIEWENRVEWIDENGRGCVPD